MTGDDHARLGDLADTLVTFIGNQAFMRIAHGHCAALVIDPEAETFLCSAYDVRPDVCRDLARGSGACRGELATKGDRPLRRLAVLRHR